MASPEVLLNGEDVSDEPTREVSIKAANYALQAAAEARESKSAARLAQQASQRTERHVETAVTTISGRVSQINAAVRKMDEGLADRDARIATELAELRLSIQTALELVAKSSVMAAEVREKSPSRQDLEKFTKTVEHAAEVIEEATTNPGVTIPSDRVRQIVKTELIVEEHGELKSREKDRKDDKRAVRVGIIVGIVLAAISAVGTITWAVMHAAAPRTVPALAP